MGQALSPYETSPKAGSKGLANGEDHLYNSISLPVSEDGGQEELSRRAICELLIVLINFKRQRVTNNLVFYLYCHYGCTF